jgi:hypothetical protein
LGLGTRRRRGGEAKEDKRNEKKIGEREND